MTTEEIAKKLCEHTYLKYCEECQKTVDTAYSFAKYWENNREYFTERANIYLEVKGFLEAK